MGNRIPPAPISVDYEWCAEETDAHGDALGLHFFDTRKEAEAHTAVSEDCVTIHVVLVRDAIRDGDIIDRQWAYLRDGKLPAEFTGGAAVPKHFLRPRRAAAGRSVARQVEG